MCLIFYFIRGRSRKIICEDDDYSVTTSFIGETVLVESTDTTNCLERRS